LLQDTINFGLISNHNGYCYYYYKHKAYAILGNTLLNVSKKWVHDINQRFIIPLYQSKIEHTLTSMPY
jgi:hypothetical protein